MSALLPLLKMISDVGEGQETFGFSAAERVMETHRDTLMAGIVEIEVLGLPDSLVLRIGFEPDAHKTNIVEGDAEGFPVGHGKLGGMR